MIPIRRLSLWELHFGYIITRITARPRQRCGYFCISLSMKRAKYVVARPLTMPPIIPTIKLTTMSVTKFSPPFCLPIGSRKDMITLYKLSVTTQM